MIYVHMYILEASGVKLVRFLGCQHKGLNKYELHPDESLPCGDEYRFYRVQRAFMMVWGLYEWLV